jgi:GTP 3',8-cyclase
MIDPFGRHIRYLRVSVTGRCVYCMAEDMEFLPKREVLTLEELLCSAFVRHRAACRPCATTSCRRW